MQNIGGEGGVHEWVLNSSLTRKQRCHGDVAIQKCNPKGAFGMVCQNGSVEAAMPDDTIESHYMAGIGCIISWSFRQGCRPFLPSIKVLLAVLQIINGHWHGQVKAEDEGLPTRMPH